MPGLLSIESWLFNRNPYITRGFQNTVYVRKLHPLLGGSSHLASGLKQVVALISGHSWLLNGSDPNYLRTLMILQVHPKNLICPPRQGLFQWGIHLNQPLIFRGHWVVFRWSIPETTKGFPPAAGFARPPTSLDSMVSETIELLRRSLDAMPRRLSRCLEDHPT